MPPRWHHLQVDKSVGNRHKRITVASHTFTVGIVTVSDRAYSGSYEDISGPTARRVVESFIESQVQVLQRVVPDDREMIAANLRDLADTHGCALVVTTGGTGPSPRDVTPEATEDVCDRLLPGFGERMRAVSIELVPTAILSRQVAGTRGKTLIVNLPGRPTAIEPCLAAVIAAVPGCIKLLGGAHVQLTSAALAGSRATGGAV